jgi:hypothetical protein
MCRSRAGSSSSGWNLVGNLLRSSSALCAVAALWRCGQFIVRAKSEIRNQESEIRNPKSGIRNQESEIRNPKSEIRNPKSFLPPRAFLAAFAVLVLFAALFLSALFFQADRAAGAIAAAGFQQRCVIVIGLHESFILGAR